MNSPSYVRQTFLVMMVAVSGFVAVVALPPTRLAASSVAVVAPPADPAGRLQNSVRRMNTWLLGNSEAVGWRRYLSLNILETQAALGPQADMATLATVRDQFASGASGLDHPVFVDVRLAIEQQIEALQAASTVDLETAFVAAQEQYRPISIHEMENQRDLAVGELRFLQDYYLRTMDLRDSDTLLNDLQLGDLKQFLGEIKFELAPESSVGKMDSVIRDVRKQLEIIIEKIDAIPTQPIDQSQSGPSFKQPEVACEQDPDEKQDLMDDLQKQRKQLESQISQLTDQRKQLAAQDAPRRIRRRETALKLRAFEQTFSEIGKQQGDPYFVSAHDSLQRLMGTFQYGTSDNLKQNFLDRLAALKNDFDEISGENARVVAGKVGDSLRWLESANQVPGLITAIRRRYSQPNVYIAISSGLIDQIGSQTVSDTQPIRENMLGRVVKGVSHTEGTVSVQLQDDPNQIRATIQLHGSVSSQTYIEQGRLRVCADGCGQLNAYRTVFANVGGLFAENAYVSANLRAFFGGTSSRLRIINKIASKKFEQSRAKAESLSTKKAEEQLCLKFMERTTESIDKGRHSMIEAQTSAVSKSQFIPQVYVRSFAHQILAVGKKSTLSTLAASNSPPLKGDSADVQIQLHDSLPSNYIENVLAGKTFTDQELKTEIESLLGRESSAVPSPEDEPDAEDESFSITFPAVRPIQFEFEDNVFRIVVSGRRFAQADKRINEGLKIIFRFKIVQADGQLKLVRDGEVEVEFLDPDKKTAKAVAFRSFLVGRLNPKEGQELPDIELPKNLIPLEDVEILQDGPIATRLRLVQCRCEDGWLYLGWNYKADNTEPVWNLDLPAIWNLDSSTP